MTSKLIHIEVIVCISGRCLAHLVINGFSHEWWMFQGQLGKCSYGSATKEIKSATLKLCAHTTLYLCSMLHDLNRICNAGRILVICRHSGVLSILGLWGLGLTENWEFPSSREPAPASDISTKSTAHFSVCNQTCYEACVKNKIVTLAITGPYLKTNFSIVWQQEGWG